MLAKAPNDFAFVLADAIRSACIKAALLPYDQARIRGLCHQGRWECALAAIRHLDLPGLTGTCGRARANDVISALSRLRQDMSPSCPSDVPTASGHEVARERRW